MRRSSLVIVLFMAALSGEILAQSSLRSTAGLDLAVTYTPERGKISNTSCDCFWLQGAGADAAFTFYQGIGVAASLTGQHASDLAGGGSVSKIDYLFGPRYTFSVSRKRTEAKFVSRIYVEGLFGGVHAFDGTFPAPVRATTKANAFAYQLGGGWEIALAHGFGLRPAEVSFYRSTLPNDGSGTQDNLRLAFGLTYRLGKR